MAKRPSGEPKKARRIMWTVSAGILGLGIALFALLLAWSPGKLEPVVDASGQPVAGSIAEKTHVRINGVEQGMVIKSRDASNPVLLYLHGGMPDYFLTQDYPTGLEDHFTIVWWDQRGSGLSFDPDMPEETITTAQIVDDTIEVTNYLRRRFGQDKIYLMGHSGGTFMGIQAAARRPDLYHAYIAVAQMTHQIESEKLAHAYLLKRYRSIGDDRMARKLEQAPVSGPPLPEAWSRLRDVTMHDQGVGTCRDTTSIGKDLMLRSFRFREFTLAEKVSLWRGKIFSGQHLWNDELSRDLRREVSRLDVPVYFFHGVHDYTVSYPMAKQYFNALDAPKKGFYTFRDSAHSPIFEEPGRVAEIIGQDVLTGGTTLADVR